MRIKFSLANELKKNENQLVINHRYLNVEIILFSFSYSNRSSSINDQCPNESRTISINVEMKIDESMIYC